MKKMIMVLLSVMILCSTGCSAAKDPDAAETAGVSQRKEAAADEAWDAEKGGLSGEDEILSSEEIRASEGVPEPSAEPQPALQEVRSEQKQEKSAENRASEQKKQDVKQQNPQETDSSTEKKPSDSEREHADDPSEKTAQRPGQSAQQQPETQTKAQPEQQQKQEAKGYSPQNVVSLATAKTKAYGKITLTDNLNSLLAEGTITQEEYNEYYPYDGAGYYSVFVQTDLNRASTTSGKSLSSEDAIAQYIADMLGLESGPYFLIEYAGTYSTGGEDFYEFRCYRA